MESKDLQIITALAEKYDSNRTVITDDPNALILSEQAQQLTVDDIREILADMNYDAEGIEKAIDEFGVYQELRQSLAEVAEEIEVTEVPKVGLLDYIGRGVQFFWRQKAKVLGTLSAAVCGYLAYNSLTGFESDFGNAGTYLKGLVHCTEGLAYHNIEGIAELNDAYSQCISINAEKVLEHAQGADSSGIRDMTNTILESLQDRSEENAKAINTLAQEAKSEYFSKYDENKWKITGVIVGGIASLALGIFGDHQINKGSSYSLAEKREHRFEAMKRLAQLEARKYNLIDGIAQYESYALAK